MSEAPFFSVVIPALNEAERLPRLLAMFARQTFLDFELIVVDAHSQDDTKTVISRFKAPYRLKIHQSDLRHPGTQRNLGAHEAAGHYIAFFDADTQIGPRFLEKIHIYLGKHPVDFCATRMIPDTKNLVDRVMTYMVNIAMIVLTACGLPFMSASNIFMKRDVFKKIGGFDRSVLISDDHELVQRAAKKGYKGKIFYNPVHVFSFRRFEREGRFTVTGKYTKALLYMLRYGPIREPIYEYKMGGKVQ